MQSSEINNNLDCKLLRINEFGEWCQCQSLSKVSVNNGNIVLRESKTNILQCDIPYSSIKGVEIVTQLIFKFDIVGSNYIAIKFENINGFKKFKSDLLLNKINVIEAELINNQLEIPDLNDPRVQEYVLKLLFSENFDSFVSDIECLLEKFKQNI